MFFENSGNQKSDLSTVVLPNSTLVFN
uniref:Uncharacterized protein n=1 Tax=Anguilla anguilla TaxID=7936 RepID=A0A0E9TJH5_ANGAN